MGDRGGVGMGYNLENKSQSNSLSYPSRPFIPGKVFLSWPMGQKGEPRPASFIVNPTLLMAFKGNKVSTCRRGGPHLQIVFCLLCSFASIKGLSERLASYLRLSLIPGVSSEESPHAGKVGLVLGVGGWGGGGENPALCLCKCSFLCIPFQPTALLKG